MINSPREAQNGKKVAICNWICENGTEDDFKYFEVVFSILEDALRFFEDK